MTSHVKRWRKQRAILWEWQGWDRYGEPVLAAPVDIRVRWLDKQAEGGAADATAVVAQEIAVGSQMWLAPDRGYSALEQWFGTGSQGHDSGVMEVVGYSETPTIKGRRKRRTVTLRFFRDAPGDLE